MTTYKQTRKLPNTGGLLWKLMLVALLIWLLQPTAVSATNAENATPKRVLAIFAFKQGMPFTYHVEQGMRAAFALESDFPVELDVEHADRSRFPEEALLNKLVELYRYKYSRRPVDLVIALGGKAPELLLACGKDLFGDIPVVVISSNPKYLLNELKQFHITPLLWGMDFKKTVQLIQNIRPQTKNFFVVSGVSLGDENIYKRVMAALRENAGDLHVQSLKDLAVGNLLQKVRKLPKDSAILFGSYFRDADGQPYISREILSTISQTANAPTFGAVDTYLGHGIVGSSLLSAEYQGKRLANIAVDLLKGEPIDDAGTTVEGNLPMFDWRQLKRWGIDEKKLPPGSIVRYRERSIWEEHKGIIIGVVILILAQTFLVAHLLVQRKRRSLAEQESQRLRDELNHISRVLAMGEIAASLAHELNQPLTAIQSYAQAAERFLAADQPDLDEVGKSLSGIVAGNRRAKEVIERIRLALKKEPLERAPIHVKGLIQETISIVKKAADEKKVVLRLDLDPELPDAFGDRIQLQQVLLNLIINGFEAMGDVSDGSRELVVRASQGESDSVTLSVQDSGIGIDDDEGELLTFGINPSVGYRLNNWLSIGGGFNIIYAELTQKAAINNGAVPGQAGLPDGEIKLEDDDVAYGFNLGILLEPWDDTRFGISYRSELDLEFKDVASLKNIGPVLQGILNLSGLAGSKVDIDMTVPQLVMASGYHQLTDRWAVMGNIGWQDWSAFGKQDLTLSSTTSTAFTKDLDYDDTWHFALGVQYRFAERWLWSVGAAYDTSPTDEDTRTPDLPLDRQIRIGTGIQYDWSENVIRGAAYEYLDAGEARIDQGGGPLQGPLKGEYDTMVR